MKPNRIRNLEIKGFKGFSEKTKFGFANLTVFAGANSVGKSSVVQAILLSRIASENMSNKVPLNGNYRLALGKTNQITFSKEIFFQFTFEDGSILDCSFDVPLEENYLIAQSVHTIGLNNQNVIRYANFHYLNAERIGPRPLYEDAVQQEPSTGHQGEFAVQLLAPTVPFNTLSVKNFHKKLQITGGTEDNLTEQSNLWMQFVMPGTDLSAKQVSDINRSVASFNQHTPPNVGFGISYVLPIIVSGLIAEPGSLFIVENPEAHLHPFGQSRIGQFLAVIASTGVQVVVETHSEHVINGIRVASLSGLLPRADVLINFLSRAEDDRSRKIKVTPIEVDSRGDLTDFPHGFFDQSAQDLIRLTKIRMQKP